MTQLSQLRRAAAPAPSSPLWGPPVLPIARPHAAPRPPSPLGTPPTVPAARALRASPACRAGAVGAPPGRGTRPRPASRPARTRTAVQGVDPGEARQAPVAQRLHARGSGRRRRRRRLRQLGNPSLIAQQRREGARGGRQGRRGAGRGGQPGRPELPRAGWRRGEGEEEAGKQVAGRSEPGLLRGQRRTGQGSRAAPGVLPAPLRIPEPRPRSPRADEQLPPGSAAPSSGRGAGRNQWARAPAPPPPPQHASGAEEGRLGERGSSQRWSGGPEGVTRRRRRQAQAASPSLAGPSRIPATCRLGATGRPLDPQGRHHLTPQDL